MAQRGWIGVDLDGTLAEYDGWVSSTHIGPPVPLMLERVKGWLAQGWEVRIFTARVSAEDQREAVVAAIKNWLADECGGLDLVITNVKDYGMVQLWDDRAVQVIPNTGQAVGSSTRRL